MPRVAALPSRPMSATPYASGAGPTLPPPPEPIETPAWLPHRPPRIGELTPAWRLVLGIAWAGVVLGLAAVWKSARTLGLSTWWLGPETEPNVVVVQVLPFLLPIALVAGTMRNVRHLPWAGIAVSVVVAVVAAFDIDRSAGIAAVEFGLAAAGLLVSVASMAGLYRRARATA